MFDKDSPTPPYPPPKCTGDLDYAWLTKGPGVPFEGLLFTQDAANCLVSKYNWCVQAWTIQVDSEKKQCAVEKNFAVSSMEEDLKRCSKDQEKLTQVLNSTIEDSNKWYKSPWFAAALGFVAGAAITTGVAYVLTR